MKKKHSKLVLFCTIVLAVIGAVLGWFAWMEKLPFLPKKQPIHRSFERGEGELRRGNR